MELWFRVHHGIFLCLHVLTGIRGRYLFAISAVLMAITGRSTPCFDFPHPLVVSASSSSPTHGVWRDVRAALTFDNKCVIYLLIESRSACSQHMLSENMSFEGAAASTNLQDIDWLVCSVRSCRRLHDHCLLPHLRGRLRSQFCLVVVMFVRREMQRITSRITFRTLAPLRITVIEFFLHLIRSFQSC